MITKVTAANLAAFLGSQTFALLLVDSAGDQPKDLSEQFRRIATEAETAPGVGDFAFGECDAGDAGLADFLAKYQALAVPAVLYLWGGQPVKTVIGSHSIKEQVVWLLDDIRFGTL